LLQHKKSISMFSKACEYAIRSIIFIATSSLEEKRVGFKEIAEEIDAPEAFTAKILQKLSKNNFIQSTRGVNGGFEIGLEQIKNIYLHEIVDLFDGDRIYKGCGLGLAKCSNEHPCPVHDQFKIIREKLSQMLQTTNIYELATGIKSGNYFLRT